MGIRGSPGPGSIGIYWSFSSGALTSTSSHMCGSWNLPIFLFRDGSLTLINIASLMALAIFWSSLPTMLKLFRDTLWPVMLWWSRMGDGVLMCSQNLSPKVLPDSPIGGEILCIKKKYVLFKRKWDLSVIWKATYIFCFILPEL